MYQQLTVFDVMAEGPQVGEEIEYASYKPGSIRDPVLPWMWTKAVVVRKEVRPNWPKRLPDGSYGVVDRIALFLEWTDSNGRKRTGSCFVDHQGYTWRFPGSDYKNPDPY